MREKRDLDRTTSGGCRSGCVRGSRGALMSRWLCGQRVHAPPREQRPARSRSIPEVYDVYSPVWGCLLLPLCSSQESPQQEGWCQGKRARLLVSFFFFSPLSVFALGCMSTTLKSFCVPRYFHPSENTSAKGFDEIIADLVKSFSLLLRFFIWPQKDGDAALPPVFVFFCDFLSLLLSVTGASQIIFFHLLVLFCDWFAGLFI